MDDTAAGLATLEDTLGHHFAKKDLLIEALTHPSAVRRRGISKRGYERLEFLGDRVLGLVIAELLWRRFPNEAEGELTRRHTHLVRREALAEVAEVVGLGSRLIASPGEDAAGVRENASILSDVCEAVIAALYLDGGLEAARRFIGKGWQSRLTSSQGAPPRDPKTALQEFVQAQTIRNKKNLESPESEREADLRATAEDPIRRRNYLMTQSMLVARQRERELI